MILYGEITSRLFPRGKIRLLLNNGKTEILLEVGIIINDICIVSYNL